MIRDYAIGVQLICLSKQGQQIVEIVPLHMMAQLRLLALQVINIERELRRIERKEREVYVIVTRHSHYQLFNAVALHINHSKISLFKILHSFKIRLYKSLT